MGWPFFPELGHLSFDDTRVDPILSSWEFFDCDLIKYFFDTIVRFRLGQYSGTLEVVA